MKFACVVSCVALASLVPVLVAHERPHLWLERSIGVKGEDAWRAKLYAARVITLPAAALAWLAGVACGAVPAAYALPLLAECVWLWWLVATLAGGLAYEMPEQPGLALILTACATLGAGGLTAFAWPAGLAIYALGVQQLGRMVDEYAKFTSQLKLATTSQREYAAAYADVKRIATQSTQGLMETGVL